MLSVESRFSRNIASHSAGPASASGCMAKPPTVCATPSSRPKRATTRAIPASQEAVSSRSSPGRARCKLGSSRPCGSRVAASPIRSTATSAAPSRARQASVARPRLPAAPVTRITRRESGLMGVSGVAIGPAAEEGEGGEKQQEAHRQAGFRQREQEQGGEGEGGEAPHPGGSARKTRRRPSRSTWPSNVTRRPMKGASAGPIGPPSAPASSR